MSADLSWNLPEFNAAFLEYWHYTKKDLVYTTNRVALNVAIKAQAVTPLANEAKIRALPQREWWPKYVAKAIIGRRKGRTVKVGKSKFKVFGSRDQKREGRIYTRETARAVSHALIESRIKKIGFIAAGWNVAIKILSRLKNRARLEAQGIDPDNIGNPSRIYKRRLDDHGWAKPAIEGPSPVAFIVNKAAGALAVASAPLAKAMALAAADMRKFVRDGLFPTAKKYAPESK